MKLLVMGCGFLASHILPHLLPHFDQFILLDREKIEAVNYDNYILPVHAIGKRKVTALGALLAEISKADVTMVHRNVKGIEDLLELHQMFEPNMGLLSFDNVRSRILARDYGLRVKMPILSLAVTENYVYVDWTNSIEYPKSEAEIVQVERAMAKVRDVCTRLDMRPLGALAAALGYQAVLKALDGGDLAAYHAWTGDKLTVMEVERDG